MLKLLLGVGLLAASELLQKSPRGRIVGGYEVTPSSKYPWVVSLALMGSHQCGGVAYRPSLVLTAAHCTIFDDEDWTVRFRYHDFTQQLLPRNEFAVAERRPHPQYSSKHFDLNDVAMWRIHGAFDLQPAEYAAIDKDSLSYSEGRVLKVVGWGGLKQGAASHSRLMEVELPTFNVDSCIRALATKQKVVDPRAMFCAGFPEGGRDACQGDSGGPVFTLKGSSPVLVGIVSWGYGCALPGFPAVFTRLQAYTDFVQSQF